MVDGKKAVAQKIVYKAMDMLKESVKDDTELSKKEPLDLVRLALENQVVKANPRRIGGAAYQVPMPVKGDRRECLAIRWLIKESRKRSSKEFNTFADKLSAELIDAINRTGGAVKKRNETHKAAEANKAFAHFRW